MPDEPSSSPSAGEGPIDTGSQSESTPSSPDVSTLSNRQILDLPDTPETTDEGGATVAAAPEGNLETEPGKEPEPAKETTATPPEAGLKVEETLTPVVETDALKAAFKLPHVGAELKARYYMSKAVEELYPTVGEIRELKQMYPTVADAKTAHEGFLSFQTLADRFYSAKETDHQAFFESLREEDPEQFKLVMRSAAALQYKHDRDGWVQDSEYRIGNALRAIRSQAEGRGEVEKVEAVDLLYQHLFGEAVGVGRVADPRDQKIRELEEREQTRTQQERESQFTQFYSSVNDAATTKIEANIKSQMEKLLPSDSGFDDDFKSLIAKAIYDQVNLNIHSSTAFHQKLKAAMRGGAYDRAHKEACVNLTANEANLLIAEAAKQIVPKFTRSVIARNQQKLDQIRQTGARKDVGSGSGYTETPRKPSLTQEQLNRMSERQILDA